MPYTTGTTFAQARTQLSRLLGDPSAVYWVDNELKILIWEALRTWNCFTQFWKSRGAVPTVAGTAFYDLPTAMPALLGYNVTDQDLVGSIEYSLMEPYSVAAWTGSGQFSLEAITAAMNRRRNQFLLETGLLLTNAQAAMPPVPVSRFNVSDRTIGVRWAWWKDLDSVYSTLWRQDEFAMNAFNRSWAQTPTRPKTFSVALTPPLGVQVSPIPVDIGTVDLLTIVAPAELNPAVGVLLNIPDDYAWVIRFGVLADLLGQEGTATDPTRSAYCEQRWKEGIECAREGASVLSVRINDVPVQALSLQGLNTYRANWRNESGTPERVAMAGYNMIAAAPVPDAIDSISMDVVQNAVLPVNDLDWMQVGQEELEVILGYAQHLGAFKQGGTEFQATTRQYENFYRLASAYNQKMRANSVFWEALKDLAIRPVAKHWYRDPVAQKSEGASGV